MKVNAQDLRRLLKGRRIVETEAHAFRDGRGGVTYNPVLVLDDGSRVSFAVHETDVGEYGVDQDVERQGGETCQARVMGAGARCTLRSGHAERHLSPSGTEFGTGAAR